VEKKLGKGPSWYRGNGRKTGYGEFGLALGSRGKRQEGTERNGGYGKNPGKGRSEERRKRRSFANARGGSGKREEEVTREGVQNKPTPRMTEGGRKATKVERLMGKGGKTIQRV